MNFIEKLLNHLSSGTLTDRIVNWKRHKVYKKWLTFNESENDSIVKEVNGRLKIKLYKNDLLTQSIFFNEFEVSEIHFLQELLKRGDVMIDVGANIGLFTLLGASLVGNTGKIYAFEPSKLNFKRLQENIALNNFSNIVSKRLALSDKVEKRKMWVSSDGLGALNSLVEPTSQQNFKEEEIETTSLNNFFKSVPLKKLKLIKLDVEGWELLVLRGGAELIKSFKPTMLIEFNDNNYRAAGYTCQDLYKFVASYGYRFYSFNKSSGRLEKSPMKNFYSYENLVAVSDQNGLKGILN